MDNKRTQRIIGLVVVIALVIILFPVLFGKNDSHVKSLAKNTSEQPVAETAENNAMDISNEIAIPPAETDTAQTSDADIATQPTTADITSELADEVNKNVEAEASKVQTITQPLQAPSLPAATPPAQNTSNVVSVLNTKHEPVTPKVKNVRAKANATDLTKLKKSAWVVQMGSFRDKANARHLADKLRSAGYKAFMHEAKSGATRVFIGPEFKQTSAMKLSSDVERDTKMRGIVVIYKPLAI